MRKRNYVPRKVRAEAASRATRGTPRGEGGWDADAIETDMMKLYQSSTTAVERVDGTQMRLKL